MSTTIAALKDKESTMEVYEGSAGCCIFISRNGIGEKFWLNSPEQVDELIWALELARQGMEKR